MKKTMAMFLAAMLMMSAVFCASAEGVSFSTKYFKLTLPDDWEVDMDDLESEEGIESLGFFGASDDIGIVAAAYLVYYEDLKEISLWNADESTLQEYADAVMADFEDDDPEMIGTVMAGSIPFILIKAQDEDGDYLYADTITNGYAIEFQVFVLDAEGETQYPMTDEYIEEFTDILMTFEPVS